MRESKRVNDVKVANHNVNSDFVRVASCPHAPIVRNRNKEKQENGLSRDTALQYGFKNSTAFCALEFLKFTKQT